MHRIRHRIFETQLAQDEIVETVRIPKLSAEARWGYVKLCRKSAEFAEALAVAVADRGRGLARIVLGAANGAPLVLDDASQDLARAAATELRGAIAADLDRAADRHLDDFQCHLLTVAAMRAVQQVAAVTAIRFELNGAAIADDVQPRLSFADFLRERRNLTGTHLGCEHGVCGACTVLVDGEPARSCLMLAVACDGREVRTIEGFADDPVITALRHSFHHHHGLQCGFCTPAMLITARDLIRRGRAGSEREIRDGLAGNICRCTGYTNIVTAIAEAAKEMGGRRAMPNDRGIGASLLRREDERHLHGRGQFVADIKLPGTMEVAFVRSPHAHARIQRSRCRPRRAAASSPRRTCRASSRSASSRTRRAPNRRPGRRSPPTRCAMSARP